MVEAFSAKKNIKTTIKKAKPNPKLLPLIWISGSGVSTLNRATLARLAFLSTTGWSYLNGMEAISPDSFFIGDLAHSPTYPKMKNRNCFPNQKKSNCDEMDFELRTTFIQKKAAFG